jgi:hypothetical protein
MTDNSVTFPDRISYLKIKIVQDKVVRTHTIPCELWTDNLRLVHCGTKGRWSEQTIKAATDSDTSEIFLKLDPRSNPGDKGIYFLYITVEQHRALPLSNTEVAKFDFHLKGSTIGRHPICAWVRRLWSWPSISQRIDNERTPEIAQMELPFVEQ